VLGDHTLSVRFDNTSGSAINASSSAAMTGSVWLIGIYQKG